MSTTAPIDLTRADLRAVAAYAASCAQHALFIFEQEFPTDVRPRAAIEAAQAFARGAERTKALRDAAWGAQRAAHEARDQGHHAASMASRAALAAAGAAFLHPLARADQVKHILGAAAYAVLARESSCADDPGNARELFWRLHQLAPPAVIDVLRRYPAAPPGGGPAGSIIRELDRLLREV